MLNDIKINDSSALLSPQKNKTLQVIYISHEFFKAIGLQFSFSIIYIYIYIYYLSLNILPLKNYLFKHIKVLKFTKDKSFESINN
jgi:hypothetical protein